MKTRITKLIKLSLTATLFGLCLATQVFAGMPGNSHAFGKTLAGWNEIYERWLFGVLAVPIDGNGNAVVSPHVVLMPFPNTPGDGTPPDPLLDISIFQTLNITFQIDGRTVINQSNVLKFYSEFFFNPPIPITGFPPVNSIIWFQGIGIAHHPLSVGTHTFKLDAVNTQPAFGGFFEYHNTWTVTVQHK